ncbi:MAG: right-handed parallel beta-helix repeat-containing protein [Sedimentisphaerales bacterium]|nr:right-handed parallel beta-helix repeat-containing protein [Sedimentisphaerales bacterium]
MVNYDKYNDSYLYRYIYYIQIVLLIAAGTVNAATINVGNWDIDILNNPIVEIPVIITGGEDLTDMVLRVQIADGGPEAGGIINGPHITAISYNGSIWETAPEGYHNFFSCGIPPGNVPQLIEDNISIFLMGEAVPANGIVATISVDASEFGPADAGSVFDLKLTDTLTGSTDFGSTSVSIINGTITLVDNREITLITPNGGEEFATGMTYPITWSCTGSISEVLIEYSPDNGSSWLEVTPPNTGNSGSYDWLVPVVESSSQCLLRVSDAGYPDINDTSDDAFTIKRIIYVKGDATGANDGANWDDAFVLLQNGLDAAISSDEIWVAAGTYKPTEMIDPCDPRTATFQMKNGVGIYGGFPAEGNPGCLDRDPNIYETIFSGDLLGNDNPATPVEDLLDDPCRADNCYHVFYHPEGTNLDATAILDGVTITAGNIHYNHGAGMYNYSSSPSLTGCTFTSNSAGIGGGLINLNTSTMTMRSCTFKGNSSYSGGGGMSNNKSSLIAIDCNFTANYGGSSGGGMTFSDGSLLMKRCTFTDNETYYGSGLFNFRSDSTLVDCIFIGNMAYYGGAILNQNSSPTVTGCTFSGNWAGSNGGGLWSNDNSSPTVSNCIFIGNSSDSFGGGMHINYASNATVTGCTFIGNSAGSNGGGIYHGGGCFSTVSNCIFWSNTALDGTHEIYYDKPRYPPSFLEISYCNIAGCGGSGLGWDSSLGEDGGGNIDADPLFVDPGYWDEGVWFDGDFHLLPDSPCIDAGDPNSPWEAEPWPNGARVNMGAYGNTPEATQSRNGLQFEAFEVIDSTRVGRTVFEYVLSLSLTNITDDAMTNVQVNLINATEQVVSVSDDSIVLPVIDAHSTVNSDDFGDYFVVTIDRAQLITPGRLTWQVDYSAGDMGGSQLMSASLPIEALAMVGDLTGDEKVTLDDVARLGEYWLRDSPELNLSGDEIINIEDLVVLARHWLDGTP